MMENWKSGLLAALAVVVLGAGAAAGGESARVGKLEHTVSLDVEYPVTGQAKVDRVVQEWLEKHLKEVMESMAGVALDPDYDESANTISVTFHETKPSERVTSYQFETYVYPWRAAHPMSYASVLNVDLDKREELRLDDVFAYPDRALKLFSEKAPLAVKRDLAEQHPDQFENGVPDDSLFMEGFEPDRDNYQALSLEPNGVRIIFQLYQVLPYVFGKPEAFIPLAELEEAGPRLGLWGR